MKDLKTYLLGSYEAEDEPNLDAADAGSDADNSSEEKPDKKVTWLTNNEKFQKIEYKYEDKEKDIYIDFLLGFQDNSWKLWIGKIGAISYDDDPWCDFRTSSFKKAILAALDKVVEFIDDVEEDPQNWIQFYKKL